MSDTNEKGASSARARTVRALCALFATGVLTTASAHADGVQVQLAGSHILSVSAGGATYGADQLVTATSIGEVSAIQSPDFPVSAADNLNLQSYFARNQVANGAWRAELGSWWDHNGNIADFFLFEVGGNDVVRVAPVMPNGSIGQLVTVSGWTPTGYVAVTGPNAGQMVQGLSFKATDLRKPNGQPLAMGEKIQALHFEAPTIDGASFAAVATKTGPKFQVRLPKGVDIPGEPSRWSPMEIWLQGPTHSELDVQPNPFLDYRLQVTMIGPGGVRYEVPGFFDGNGLGGSAGSTWKVRFTPTATGTWQFEVSFRSGNNVAVSLDALAGQPTAFDGLAGTFQVDNVSPLATGFHRKGMLQDVGEHYLRFQDGTWFLKGGTNSPENLMAYFGFDDIANSGNLGLLHRYIPHRGDWRLGDPDWKGNTTNYDARGLIGALNYLAQEGVNSVYFLPMNLGGDGQDTCPFVGQAPTDYDKLHYDISRLHQWNQSFEHAQSKGILLHVVLAETELANETWLDGGVLGLQRKLFFRELSARFAHHNALQWNLSEENDYPVSLLNQFADYLAAVDPYRHPITVHNYADFIDQYTQLAGNYRFSVTSNQYTPDSAGATVETLRNMSKSAGRPWAVCLDENWPAATGLQPNNADDLRKRVLWDAYLSGAAGVEWYFGYQPLPIGGDLDVEDFRTRAPMWRSMRIARQFITTNLPFTSMQPADYLLSGENGAYGGGEVFASLGTVYAIYLPSGSPSGTLDMNGVFGTFRKRWFNPRSGNFEGSQQTFGGNTQHALGTPPNTTGEDWVVLIQKL
ncbi:MAG TPA: DUF5060 domain-containing protein [Planctomycetota bacterium]|nr:DUF5060 domain-containing protein [Planctomycetota bacterium]